MTNDRQRFSIGVVFAPLPMIYAKPHYEPIVRPYSAAFLLVSDDGRRRPSFSIIGATAGFVSTPERRFILTALHVWTEITAQLSTMRRAALCTHNQGRLERLSGIELVDRNEELDIAVLWHPFVETLPLVPSAFSPMSRSSPKACYRTNRWPARPVIDGEELCLSGYPRQLRSSDRRGRINCVSCFIEDRCNVSRYGTIYMADGGPARRQLNHEFGTPTVSNLGGISGAPVFAKRDGGVELIGVVRGAPVYDNGEANSAEAANATIRVSPINSLTADGRFL